MKQLNDQYFNYRQTPVDYDGIAKIESLKGKTIVWNQMCTPVSTWSRYRCTNTTSGNVMTITADTQTSNYTYGVYMNGTTYPQVAGHKYLFKCTATINFTGSIKFGFGDTNPVNPTTITANVPYNYTVIITATENNQVWNFMLRKNGAYPTTSDIVTLDSPMAFDLTLMFGAGNEPTVEEFESMFPSKYYTGRNEGELLNFNGAGVNAVGKNLFNVNSIRLVDTGITATFGDGSIRLIYGGGSRYRGINYYRVEPYLNGFLPKGKYTVSFDVKGLDTQWAVGARRLSNSSFDATGRVQPTTDGHYSFLLDTTNLTEDYFFSFTRIGNLTTAFDITFSNIQIEFGETETPFESFKSEYSPLPISWGLGKNLLPHVTPATLYGVTYTLNADGTVIANGTSTNNSCICFSSFTLPTGNYIYSGCAEGGSSTTCDVFVWDVTANARAKRWDKTTNVTGLFNDTECEDVYIDGTHTYTLNIRCKTGTVAENLLFKPMVCLPFADNTYESYKTVPTYFPNGMKSAGDVYDEITDSKAITRIGTIDLGTLTWSYDNPRFVSTTALATAKAPSANTSIANILCEKYDAYTVTGIGNSDKVIGLSTGKYISIVDTSAGTDPSAFKTSLSGVYMNYELETYSEEDISQVDYRFLGKGTEQLVPLSLGLPSSAPVLEDARYYVFSESEVPYRVFWAINSKGDRWDFTEREFKSFMNNPQGLGFSKTISVNRYGNVQNLTDITDNFPQPNGEILFYDSSNSTRYDKYNQFVKFLSYEPITLYYKIPVSFYSRIPNTYSLECVVGTLTKTESKTDNMMNCSITYNALSFYKGEEVEISGTGTSYTINNDSDFPIGFEITITGSPVNPYFTLTQDGEMYGEAKFTDSTAFSSVYVNSNDGEQNVELQQGGSVLPNPLSYQDLSISNGSIYVTFVKLARGESTLTIGKDSGSITGVDIVFTPIYRSV